MSEGVVAKAMPVAPAERSIDWANIAMGLFVGVVFAVLKTISMTRPEWRLGSSDALIPCMLTIGYIIYRGRRQPEKLDEWGITAPITLMAFLGFLLILGIGVGGLAAFAYLYVGEAPFGPVYASKMVQYLVSAFPQQFFVCSVVLASLETLRPLRGNWRLPIAVGLLFGLAHIWTPVYFPGTQIPVQVPGTFLMAFLGGYYYLRFRTILPLVAWHAILYVCLKEWIEAYM